MAEFRKIHESELFPTEKLGPKILGTVEFKVGDQSEFNGAYITTNERLFMNIDMGEKVYERVVGYNEINDAFVEDDMLVLDFHMGAIKMKEITEGSAKEFAEYVKQITDKIKERQEKAPE